MYTSILLLAVAMHVGGTPSWRTDYLAARDEGARAKKPLAIFLGSGPSGWKELPRGGELGDARRILADGFVCVYIDRDTENGKLLAEAFEMTGSRPGIVISDVSGEFQAFRHQGDLAVSDLAQDLQRYGDPSRPVRATETNPGPGRSSYYEGPAAESSSPPAYQSSYYPATRNC